MEISDKEIVHLARLAIEGKADDVAMLIQRVSQKIRDTAPETAETLMKLAKKQRKNGIVRGGAVAVLPVDLESRLQLARVENRVRLREIPVWMPETEHVLQQVIEEREQEEVLAQAGLNPARSMLLVGPPGVGKTLSARWLASKLSIPLISLDLAAVMSSLLGRTGNNLRNVLDYAKGTRCVLLLDEFDSIAKRRDDVVEVGELKRLVTVLLQEIDTWPPSGLLIAATNHPDLLDPAIWRRFDLVVKFDVPDAEHVRQFITTLLGNEGASLIDALTVVMTGMSFSDIERDILRTKRQSILARSPLAKAIEALIGESVPKRKLSERKAVAAQLAKLGYSQHKTHQLTGVSRDTIRKDVIANELEDDDG